MSDLHATDPTGRFTDRVDNYARYRPTYPAAVIKTLRESCGLSASTAVADVGSGTGILTALLLAEAGLVYAVEPNDAMREAAEQQLRGREGFVSINGRAEATTLPDRSVDLVTAAQAFHWFDPVPTRAEFRRILRPGGWVALVWNRRLSLPGSFGEGYEKLLEDYGREYQRVRHANRMGNIDVLFTGGYELLTFGHEKRLTYEGIHGGLLSASYAPLPGDPRYEPMIARLRALFEQHEQDGVITLSYETQLYLGRLP